MVDNNSLNNNRNGTDNKMRKTTRDRDESATTTIADHLQDRRSDASGTCVVYKFTSRPPYEGFILILIIVLLTAILIWWLNSKFTSD
jgi:hypothetical protein